MNKIGLFLFALVMGSQNVWAATAQGTGTISAQIVSALSVDESKMLNFGTMTGEAGVISVNTSGTRSSTTGNLVEDTSNSPSEGEMLIYGPLNQVVYIGTISDTVITSGINSMNVTNFQTDHSGSMTLTSNNGNPVKIGAQLTVSDGQASGNYTGSYTLTVTY